LTACFITMWLYLQSGETHPSWPRYQAKACLKELQLYSLDTTKIWGTLHKQWRTIQRIHGYLNPVWLHLYSIKVVASLNLFSSNFTKSVDHPLVQGCKLLSLETLLLKLASPKSFTSFLFLLIYLIGSL